MTAPLPYAILILTVAFSIVIPSKNEEREIGNLLESIKEQTSQPEEIILSDRSTDSTRKVAEKYGVRFVDGTDDGRIGKARNLGAKGIETEYLIFFDADTTLPTVTFLEDAITCMEGLSLDVASVYYRPVDKCWKSSIVFAFINLGKKIDSFLRIGFGTGGAAMIFRTSVFRKLGGFNNDIRISEDMEVTRRAVREGYSFAILPLSIDVSTRRFTETSVLSILRTVLGGAGTMATHVFKISSLSKYTDKFDEWYGPTGGDIDRS